MKTRGCAHVTGWICKRKDLNRLCPKISPITVWDLTVAPHLGRLYCLINSNMLGAEETPSCKEENEHKNPNSNTEREVWWEVVNNAKPFKERVVKKRGNTMHYGEEE